MASEGRFKVLAGGAQPAVSRVEFQLEQLRCLGHTHLLELHQHE